MPALEDAPIDIWTGKRDPAARPVTLSTLDRFGFPVKKTFYVAPRNEEHLRAFNKRLIERGRTVLFGVLGFSALMVALTIAALVLSWPAHHILLVVGLLSACIGVTLWFFPFPTPETVRWLGVRKAVRLTRLSGLGTVFFGLAVAFFL